MINLAKNFYRGETVLQHLECLAPLALRLFLAPIMLQSGWTKLASFENTASWFEHSLGLPFPELMVVLAAGTEFIGGIMLIAGLGIRIITPPLIIVMLVAALTVHWDNGWLVLSDASSWLANDRVMEAVDKKQRAIAILREHGNYGWLTSSGRITILNNGIEFAATYFLMLLSLFFTGGGRYTSIDYWISHRTQEG
ncbi:MAG: DoxX family membrane protein [Pseudomonadales bacterium]|nr:DoxX family membrane protein [Pseudomonadales bacterium]